MTAVALGDAGARSRIAEDLDANLVVIAGAGTGKTTALVGRIVALVRSGTPLREIAAITFTEAAAAELRERIRAALEGADHRRDDAMSAARHEVDDTAIGTLHSFAQRILLEQCVDAGLPPELRGSRRHGRHRRLRGSLGPVRRSPVRRARRRAGADAGIRPRAPPTDLAAIAWNSARPLGPARRRRTRLPRRRATLRRPLARTDARPVIDRPRSRSGSMSGAPTMTTRWSPIWQAS
jgi:hypothetical protein